MLEVGSRRPTCSASVTICSPSPGCWSRSAPCGGCWPIRRHPSPPAPGSWSDCSATSCPRPLSIWPRPWSGRAGRFEAVAREALLAAAEKEGNLDDVEDELFRFGRVLDREPRLAALLEDAAAPADKRIELLDQLIGGKVSPVTAALLRHTVRLPRDRHLDVVCEELAELAAARRNRSVARVTAPVALTGEQEQKLADSLSRLYGRAISLQVELDPSLMGGLVVQVGGEVIDGSVASRLAAARRALPS
jgi:F-type H+-transporting ATPase subunit delta